MKLEKAVYVHHIHGGTLIVCVVVNGEGGRAGGIGYRGRRSGMSVRNGIGGSEGGMTGGEAVLSCVFGPLIALCRQCNCEE